MFDPHFPQLRCQNCRYPGTPPLWYKPLSKFSGESHLCRPCTSQWPARSGSGGRDLGGLDFTIWPKQIPVKMMGTIMMNKCKFVAKLTQKNRASGLPSNWRQWKDSTITSHNFHLILSSSLEIHQHKLSAENPSPLGTLQIWMPTRGRGCR